MHSTQFDLYLQASMNFKLAKGKSNFKSHHFSQFKFGEFTNFYTYIFRSKNGHIAQKMQMKFWIFSKKGISKKFTTAV